MKKPKRHNRQLPEKAKAPPVAAHPLPPKEILDKLPENVRTSIVEAASFSGPLPPPSMFREYDSILPGSAERILAMAEKEQDHRTTWENKALDTIARQGNIGQWFGLLIAILCIGGAIYLAVSGHRWVAIALAVATAVGLVGRFIQNNSAFVKKT